MSRITLSLWGLIVLIACGSHANAAESMSAKELIWQAPPVRSGGAAPQELRDKLARHVRQLIAAGHMAPTRFYFGLGSQNALERNWHFWKPYEVVESLSWAWPHLPPDLQVQTLEYLGREMAKYPPWSLGALPVREGEYREYFALPDEYRVQQYKAQPGLEVCYAMWLYGHRTGDWKPVESAYADLRRIFMSGAARPPQRYSQIGGIIAYARIARQLGWNEDVPAAEAAALAALETGRDFESFFNINGRPYRVRLLHHNFAFHIFNEFPPEAGAYLAAVNPGPVEQYLKEITEIRPRAAQGNCDLWYLTLGERALNAAHTENYCLPPDMHQAVFRAMAFFRKAPGEQLARWVDIPFCRGDLYYIQRLAWTLEAYQGDRQ